MIYNSNWPYEIYLMRTQWRLSAERKFTALRDMQYIQLPVGYIMNVKYAGNGVALLTDKPPTAD